jgi:hypothetical protein
MRDLLRLERKEQADETPVLGGVLMLTPGLGPDYWAYRVAVSEGQAVVGFGKFGTIGIGFAIEEDWNSNLPCRMIGAEEIFDHIKHNKGDDTIPDARCIEAIRMIRAAAAEDMGWGSVEDERTKAHA